MSPSDDAIWTSLPVPAVVLDPEDNAYEYFGQKIGEPLTHVLTHSVQKSQACLKERPIRCRMAKVTCTKHMK